MLPPVSFGPLIEFIMERCVLIYLFLFVMCCFVFFSLQGRSVPFISTGMTAVSTPQEQISGDNFRSSLDAEYLRANSHALYCGGANGRFNFSSLPFS